MLVKTYLKLAAALLAAKSLAANLPAELEEGSTYLLQTSISWVGPTSALQLQAVESSNEVASETLPPLPPLPGLDGSSSFDPKNVSGAKIVGITFNAKGDFAAFWAGIMTNMVMAFGCFVCFLFLRKMYPSMFQHNQEVHELLQNEPYKLSDGLLAPVLAPLRVKVDDAIEIAGLDHGLLIEFAQFVMKLMLLIGAPAVCVLSPLYAFSGGHAADNRLSLIGFANVSEGSLVCWPVSLFVWYVVCSVQMLVFHTQETKFEDRRKQWLMKMPLPRANTVLVEFIPTEFRTVPALTTFYQDIFGQGAVTSVSFVRDTSQLQESIKTRDDASQDLHEAEFSWDKSGEPDEGMRTKLESALEEAEKKVVEWRDSLLKSPSGISGSAFVTFKDQQQSIMALNMRYTADDEEFLVSTPPDPSDVRFDDLQVDYRLETARHILGYGMIAGLFFGFIPIVAGVTNLLTLESISKVGFLGDFFDSNPSIAAMWSSLAASMGLTLFMSFLPTFLVLIFSYCFALKAAAWEQHYIQQWYFYFLVVFVLLVTAVGTSLWDRMSQLIQNPTDVFSLLASTLPTATHFYLNYVPVQWGTHVMNMMRYVPLAKYLGYRKVCSDDKARERAEPEDQDYYGMGSRSARHTLIAVTGLVFCTLSPLITVLCLFNGFLCRYVYAYLCVYAETKKADLGGVFWSTKIKHVQQGLLIYIVLMTGVLLQRGSSIGPGVIAASSSALWLWSYRRFNHRFHLDNLPLKDMKVARAAVKREASTATYTQPELVIHTKTPKNSPKHSEK